MSIHDDFRDIASENPDKQSPREKEIEKLIVALSEAQSQQSRTTAAKALCEIGGIAITRLISMLSHARWEVRSSAVLALAKVGQPATQAFQAALQDEDWFARATAAKSLGQVKDPQTIKDLVNILGDSEWFVRERAAEALSKIGEPAIEPLIDALKDRNGLVRERAAEVLGEIGNEKSVGPLLETFHDEELYVRARAVLAFEKVETRSIKRGLQSGIRKKQ
ncbi:MAG: HEAT repeat domain-containing protein [Halobacteriota archaeon]